MATIDVSNDHLVVRIHGLDRLLALTMSVEVPLAHVRGVRADPPEGDFDAAVKDPSLGTGVFIRGRLAVGTVDLPDGLAFYDVHDKRNAIAIDLDHERYKHIVVELDEEPPEVARQRLQTELSRFRSRQTKKLGSAER